MLRRSLQDASTNLPCVARRARRAWPLSSAGRTDVPARVLNDDGLLRVGIDLIGFEPGQVGDLFDEHLTYQDG